MVRKSELKNICKSVNDRELAALKKEIIEILKKQDSKEFKKAVDYLNSQEVHYTHLEKSLSGKWVEKAGYGIGTVRIWKGKKYKKIAPDKWVRVFDKEGRGTSIAVGKLIARVNKIDNVEDLLSFVMANKQRFVDENGIDLPILDKLRAKVDERNATLTSGKKPAKKTNNSSDEKKYKQTKKMLEDKIAEFDKQLKMFDNNPNANTQRLSKDVEKQKKNYVKMLENLENEYKKISDKPAETSKQTDRSHEIFNAAFPVLYKKLKKENPELNDEQLHGKIIEQINEIEKIEKKEKPAETKQTDYYKDISDVLTKDEKRKINERVEKYSKENEWSIPAADMKKFVKDWQSALKETDKHAKAEKLYEIYSKLEDANWHDENKKLLAGNFEYFNDKYFKDMYGEEPEEMSADKEDYKIAQSGKFATQKQVDYATEVSDKYSLTREEMLKKPITAIQKYANSRVEDFEGGIDKFIEYMADGRSEGVSLDEVGKEFGKLINHNIARKIWKDYESGALEVNDDGIFEPKKETEEEKTQNRSDAMKGNQNAYKGGSKETPKKSLSEKKADAEKLSKNHQAAVEKVIKEITDKIGSEKADRGLEYLDSYSEGYKYKGGELGQTYSYMMDEVTKVKESYGKIQNDLNETIKDYNAKDLNEYISNLQNRFDKKIAERKSKGMYGTNHSYWSEVFRDGIKLQALKDIRDNGLQLTENEVLGKEEEVKAESKKQKEETTRVNTIEDYFEEESETNPNLDKNTLAKIYDAIKNGEDTSKFNQRDVQGMADFMGVELKKNSKEKKKVRKSLFDGFLGLGLIEEDIDDMEEDEEDESLWNDYSAEQPDLFNSTEFKVREAMNRHYCNCL